MQVRFWGVRGSFVAPGAEFQRYGGNTSAVEVRADNGERLLLDLGTGVTEFAKELMAGAFGRGEGSLSVLVSHTHIDHIQGLPFFSPLFVRGNVVRILGGQIPGSDLRAVFQRQLNPHYSPLNGLENLSANVTIETLALDQDLELSGFRVRAALLPHGTTFAVAYRISVDGRSIVYMTDVEYPAEEPNADAVALARDADLLIHDATYSNEAYAAHQGWGHCSVSAAAAVAERAGVETLALFHHAPDATDREIDRQTESARACSPVKIIAASEGLSL